MIFWKDNIVVNVYDNFIDRFKCVCDDFLKGRYIWQLYVQNFIRKILIATINFFHSPFLNSTWRHFLI